MLYSQSNNEEYAKHLI